ncbi:AMP-binding protein [Pseudonocardia sp. ICBG601]|uniref:AMP-binding protein n=1 Tax=Pseudonocardia sp. ICBG601 TaxID=2846759 RepID=UPI001CF6C4A3|nr:AMP-binding protein [Pseudonocardia sp. ICBG601]
MNSFGEIVHSGHTADSVYLWTLPMFHCNGWCTPWVTRSGDRAHPRLPARGPGRPIWRLIGEHGVTHLNGAPTVVTTILNAPRPSPWGYQLVITTAGAPPSPTRSCRWSGWGSGSCTCTGSPRPTAVLGEPVPARLGRPRRRGTRPAPGPPGRRHGVR